MINPLNIASSSDAQLLAIYASTLVLVVACAGLALSFGPRARVRRHWARTHKMSFAALLVALWMGTLYGGSKTNQPPIPPPVRIFIEYMYWDVSRERFVPILIPLRRVDP